MTIRTGKSDSKIKGDEDVEVPRSPVMDKDIFFMKNAEKFQFSSKTK